MAHINVHGGRGAALWTLLARQGDIGEQDNTTKTHTCNCPTQDDVKRRGKRPEQGVDGHIIMEENKHTVLS